MTGDIHETPLSEFDFNYNSVPTFLMSHTTRMAALNNGDASRLGEFPEM
jgi:hypothetical protein